MPIFRKGSNVISIAEGNSYICQGSKDCAEWYILSNLELGKLYKVWCENGALCHKEVIKEDEKD